jgi:hypothetical protein
MAQHKVGFTGGINKDLAKDKYSNKNYFDANNIKVITDAGMSTGSIENEKGNSLLFRFPTVGARYKVTIATANVIIGGHTVGLTAGATNEATYNTIVANAGVATLIANNSVYIFFNDSGVFIQVVDTAFAVTGSVTTQTAAVSDIYIAGWCRLNEWIIVFTTDDETVEPSSALCQIWKFKFTAGSRTTIDGASGTLLVASEHLIYNDYLNFSTETYIRDTVANYETDEKGRIYWTDYYNQVRVANVFDTELMGTKPNDLGLVSEVTLSQPIIQTITNISNGLPSGAHYQYYYKLLSTDGRESIFSPGSQVIDVQEELSNNTSIDYFDLDSTPAGTIDNKSFEIEINDIDTDFDIIELYAVIWETPNSPSIYKVDDYSVTGSSMTFTHNSLDNNINIPVTEFMEIGIPFTAKTLEDRDKVLTAGNIKEAKFDLTYDARAYRFNTDLTPNFDLFSADNTSTNYEATDFASIPDDHDCINPSNDDTSATYGWDAGFSRQIYQSDGTTIGGEGTNISYEFLTHAKIGSTGSKALRDYSPADEGYNTCDRHTSNTQITLGNKNLDGTSVKFDVTDEFNNQKSNRMNAILTGYARGEVYRFAIVFYSKSGQRSYAKWIGDIKFPDPSLGTAYKVSDATGSTNSCENVPIDQSQTAIDTTTYDLGVKFTVDISSIQSQISGFEIVRVERTVSNRSRLGTGVVTNFVDYSGGTGVAAPNIGNNPKSLLRKYADLIIAHYPGAAYGRGAWANYDREIDTRLTVGSTPYGDSALGGLNTPNANLMLSDTPTILPSASDSTNPFATENKTLLNFIAPTSDFRQYSDFDINTTTDFIRDYGYYECLEYVYNDDSRNAEAAATNIDVAKVGFLYRAKKFVAVSGTIFNYRIAAERYLVDGEVIYSDLSDSDDTSLLGLSASPLTVARDGTYTSTIDLVCNTSYTFYTGDHSTPFGVGTPKQFIRLGTTTSGHIRTGADLDVKYDTTPSAWQDDHAGNNVHHFKEVGYCREITNQYGGNTYEARSKNVYISTGIYQIVNDDSATSFTINTFGGDTYVNSYAREYMRQYHDGVTSVPLKAAISTQMSIGFIFCAESPVNIAWRTGEHFGGESQDVNNYFRGSISTNLSKGDLSNSESFTLDNRHNQANNVRTDFLAKDYLLPDTFKFPNRIRVSKTKIDNELTDSWRAFPANQFDDMDGSMGQIHKLIAFKDQLIFFQDRGVGILPISERAVIEDVTGAELVLGDGQLIGKYKYLTETSGTKHQHSVVVTDRAVYYYDSSQQKIYMLQNESLTEALGLHGYFHGNIKEILRDSDELYVDSPVGVHGVYDKKNERVLYTFLGGNKIITAADGYYSVGDIILNGTSYFKCLIQGDYLTTEIIASTAFEYLNDITGNYYPGFTIGYREKLQAFESFYDFKPGKYLNFDDKLLSVDPTTRENGYIHEEGNYGSFYSRTYKSDITLVVMPSPDIISIFNNIEYLSEVTLNKKDIVNETLTSLQAYSEYQNTGEITLAVGTLAKRRMRVWRHKLKRDAITTNNINGISNPKLRNYYIFLKLSFTNNADKRLVLSDVVISYTPTRM